ncbi:hypothetical protein M758_9G140000 [Ceratodon purpureus]|nr:hypothetical protein M758_9G140000 [Ceratodon purpureus]
MFDRIQSLLQHYYGHDQMIDSSSLVTSHIEVITFTLHPVNHQDPKVEDFKLPEMVRDASDVQLEEVDVVVALKPDLSYLAAWRELLEGCHLIVMQGEDFTGAIHVPAGFDDVDVYTRCDMVRLLGPELVER